MRTGFVDAAADTGSPAFCARPLRAVSWGAPAAIVLSLDAPSLATGTGSAVYLDGEDVAAVRATVVDTNGVCRAVLLQICRVLLWSDVVPELSTT
jgi:hypothetical protein